MLGETAEPQISLTSIRKMQLEASVRQGYRKPIGHATQPCRLT
jgi:hypothetical protein